MTTLVSWLDSQQITITLSVVAIALLLRVALIRLIRHRNAILSPDHRRWISMIHHTSLLVITVTVIIIWLPQIQHFALSITAIAVALVIATKELLLCITGSVMLRATGVFAIGDWIRVGNHFGEVIEENVMTTVIQEIDGQRYHYTGRTTTVPNSVFLSTVVINQNFLRRYQFHRFAITIEPDAFPIDAEDKLFVRINALTESFAQTARRYNAMLEKRTGIDIPDAQPTIEFSTTELAKLVTTITVFCPTDQIPALEKAMMHEFLGWYRANRRGKV